MPWWIRMVGRWNGCHHSSHYRRSGRRRHDTISVFVVVPMLLVIWIYLSYRIVTTTTTTTHLSSLLSSSSLSCEMNGNNKNDTTSRCPGELRITNGNSNIINYDIVNNDSIRILERSMITTTSTTGNANMIDNDTQKKKIIHHHNNGKNMINSNQIYNPTLDSNSKAMVVEHPINIDYNHYNRFKPRNNDIHKNEYNNHVNNNQTTPSIVLLLSSSPSILAPSSPTEEQQLNDRLIENEEQNKNDNDTNHNDIPKYPYWDLSCPLEMSSYSVSHMGGSDFLKRAHEAAQLVLLRGQNQQLMDPKWWHSFVLPKPTELKMNLNNSSNITNQQEHQQRRLEQLDDIANNTNKKKHKRIRRIFFIGDSIVRQIFISLVCWSLNDDNHPYHNTTTNHRYEIAWFPKRRAVPSRHPNNVRYGEHSKFEEARVWLQSRQKPNVPVEQHGNNNSDETMNSDNDTDNYDDIDFVVELIYDHDIGNLIQLGPEYESHHTINDNRMWLESCYRNEPLTTNIVTKVHWSTESNKNTNNNDRTTTPSVLPQVERERIELTSDDVVLFNGSVHGDRSISLYNIADIANCISNNIDKNRYPHLVYMATSLEHFPTSNGQFTSELFEQDHDYECIQDAKSMHRTVEEQNVLKDTTIPIIGMDIVQNIQYHSGHLHVGNRDCLHWIMPGIPDLLAASVVDYLTQYQRNQTTSSNS